jgi:hypothetical protein
MKPSATLVVVSALVCTVVAAFTSIGGAYAATDSGTNQPSREIPRSVFEVPTNPERGRDPFYPKSTRLFGLRTTSTNAAPVSRVTFLLRGLAGAPGQRLATLTVKESPGRSLILAEGETTSLRLPGGEIRVRCVSIEDDRVLVEINGSRQELRLRDGL